MSSLLDMLNEQLGKTSGSLSREIGLDEDKTKSAVGAALPTILEGLRKRLQQGDQGGSVQDVIEKKHDGSLLDNLEDYISGRKYDQPEVGGGRDVLKDVLGGREERAAEGVGQAAGIDPKAALKVLAIVAPLVLAYLAKRRRDNNASRQQIPDFVEQERAEMERRAPQETSLIGRMLDQDGDGDFDIADMAKIGLGKLMGNR